MNRILNTLVAVIVVFAASQALAISKDKVSFNFGMGYGGFNNKPTVYRVYFAGSYYTLYEPNAIVDKGYNFFGEVSYRLNANATFGLGVQYFFGEIDNHYSGYRTFQDDYDNRKPRSEDITDFPEYIDFVMPYFTAKYEFKILRVDLFSKLSLGYGLGILETYHFIGGSTQKEAYGIGVIPCLGKSININNMTSINVELGYRYIKTSELDENEPNPKYYDNYLDFSGLFLQSSFSFNL
ncbi:MAG: hypothetical protein GY839_10750 [candidate division Zixibacteria bacterium]|nr:hypothetical protein [candidate division Zixibacteria bacterium]